MAVEMEPAPQELLQGSWRNKVPVRLTLAQDSISSPTNISPLYVSGHGHYRMLLLLVLEACLPVSIPAFLDVVAKVRRTV